MADNHQDVAAAYVGKHTIFHGPNRFVTVQGDASRLYGRVPKNCIFYGIFSALAPMGSACPRATDFAADPEGHRDLPRGGACAGSVVCW